jgi:hypothetical protein
MVKIAQEHGSFGTWLQQRVEEEGVDATAKSLADRFKYMSEEGSKRYLYAVGEDVDVSEKVRAKYGPA